MADQSLSDPETWLAQVLWTGRADEVSGRIAAAAQAGLLSDAGTLDRAAACLTTPPPGLRDILGRLRQLALALLAAGENRLQIRVWRTALDHGLDPQNGWQRLFDAARAAEDWQSVLEAGAWLLATPQPKPLWVTLTRTAVLQLLDGEGLPVSEAVALILWRTGLRFLPEMLEKLGPGPLADLMLADPGQAGSALPPAQAVLAATLLAVRDGNEAVRRFASALEVSQADGAAAVIARALGELAEGRFDTAHSLLDGLPAPAQIDLSEEILLLWALAAAGAAHSALPQLTQRLARRPGVLGNLSVLLTALGEKTDAVPALLTALAGAGLDPLALLDMRLGQSAAFDELQMQQAVALIDADTSPLRTSRVLTLARRMVEGEQSPPLTADFCRRHAAILASSQQGASILARALSVVHDWEGALVGWDAVLEHQPGAAWALGRAYYSAAKAGRADVGATYLARLDLEDAAAQPALLNVAYGACLLGDFALGARCLTICNALPETSPVRSNDRYNLAGRLQAVLTGSADALSRDLSVVPNEPAEAPPPRMLLLDPGFAVNDGHHFAYTQFAVSFFAEELGIDPAELWVCARMTDDPAPTDHAVINRSLHRLFGFNPYSFEEFPKTPRVLSNIASAWEEELTKVFAECDLDAVEVIYCHSMKATMAEGLAAWIADRFAGRRLSVILGIIEVDYMGEGADVTAACNAAYAAAVARLTATPGVHLVLYAETDFAVRELSAVLPTETKVHNIPYLAASLAGPASTAPVAFSGETVTIGLVGGSRRERGLDLFPELMLALADRPEVRWIVQMSRSLAEQIDTVFPAYIQWAVDRGICTWLDGRLDTSEYHSALRQMDVVLMPYRDRYAVSGSGVFYEALELERYLVVPEGTFMVDLLRDWSYPSAIMGSATVPAALRSLNKMLARRKALQAEMQALRAAGGQRLPVGRFRALVRGALQHVRDQAGQTAFGDR